MTWATRWGSRTTVWTSPPASNITHAGSGCCATPPFHRPNGGPLYQACWRRWGRPRRGADLGEIYKDTVIGGSAEQAWTTMTVHAGVRLP